MWCRRPCYISVASPLLFLSLSLFLSFSLFSCSRRYISECILSRAFRRKHGRGKERCCTKKKCSRKRADLVDTAEVNTFSGNKVYLPCGADSAHILARRFDVMPTPTFFHPDDDKFRYISGIWPPNSELKQVCEVST